MDLPVIEHLLEDFDTIGAAHAEYVRLMDELEESNAFAHAVARAFLNGSSLTLRRLKQALASREQTFGLEPGWSPNVYIFIGHSANEFYVVTRGNQSAVVFDVTLLLSVVVFIFLAGCDLEDGNMDRIAGYLYVVALAQEITLEGYIQPMAYQCMSLNQDVFDDLLGIVADYVLLHEIGHIYCEQRDTDCQQSRASDTRGRMAVCPPRHVMHRVPVADVSDDAGRWISGHEGL